MEKNALLVLFTVLAVGLIYSPLCLGVDHSGQQCHKAFCTALSHSCCAYLEFGVVLLVPILFRDILFLLPLSFQPSQFVDTLFKPPRRPL